MHEPIPSLIRRRLLTGCALLALAGCAAPPPVTEADRQQAWRRHQRELGRIEEWRLAARMAVRLEGEAWSASLYWRQMRREFSMRIVAPLGQGTVEISGSPGAVQLRTGDNQVLKDADVDRLLRENLGWPLPVRSLRYWVKGLPEPGAGPGTLVLDDEGRITELQQDGWRISYQAYTRVEGHAVPSRLVLQREGLTLRLIINHWQFTT